MSADGYPYGRLIGLVAFFIKTFAVYFVYVWIRGTLPRVRVDQILNYNWKFLVPLSLVLIFVVAIVDKLIPAGMSQTGRMAVHLTINLLLAFATLEALRRRGRAIRRSMSGGDGPGGREVLLEEGHGQVAAHVTSAAHGTSGDHGDTPLGAREPATVPIH